MATTVAPPLANDPTTGLLHRSVREVVPADLWDKQIGLLVRDYPYDSIMAARVLDQGYAYLLTAMKHRGASLGLAPSKLVDIGVHTIILDTVAYAELCDRFNGGHFLHHVPKVGMKNVQHPARQDGAGDHHLLRPLAPLRPHPRRERPRRPRDLLLDLEPGQRPRPGNLG
ncbi:hypothetical protein [Streptomyces sp. NPDC102264]|uniref:hypothetical protein n=1 Tax=Streptomyces sp. NPDC102264 TaxID=3366149 RepID=UPI00381BD95E